MRLCVGKSREGRDIVCYESGTASGGLFLFGAIHGDEPESRVVCERFLELASAQSGPTWTVIPVANPDGLFRAQKDNAAGVDLNRNFPSTSWQRAHPPGYDPGAHPVSEPETAAIVEILATRKPALIVAVHQPFACVNWDGPAELAVERFCAATGLPARASIGYPTPGSFGSYAGIDLKLPTITLELAASSSDETLRRITSALVDEWLRI